MRFALFGAGRAGRIHVRNIAAQTRRPNSRRTLILAWHRRSDDVWDKLPA
ncbi:MAG: hypothetical protein OXI80_11010 [Caldilineaceae bacterium]|nr:hypothetical protein [Caldilineaceae bacterium]MDE0338191.1 hypothetical protein [Caldilineaceae bacterium]